MPRRSKLTLSRFFLEPLKSTKIRNSDGQSYKKTLKKYNINTINDPFIGFTNDEVENARRSVTKIKYCIRLLNSPNKNYLHPKIHKYNKNKISKELGLTPMEKSECIVKLSRITNTCDKLESQICDVTPKNKYVTSKYWNFKSKGQFKGFTKEETTCSHMICGTFKTNLNIIQSSPIKFKPYSKCISKNSSENENYITTNISVNEPTRPRTHQELNNLNSSFKELDKKNIYSKYWNSELRIKLERCDFKLSNIESFPKCERKTSLKMKEEFKGIKKESDLNSVISLSRIHRVKKENLKKYVKDEIVTRFIPPKSPHNLIEEQLYYDPWALLIATIFLNKTACQIARPYVFWFLKENPEPSIVLEKDVNDLEIYFRALGLQTTRAKQVWRMSHDYMYKNWKRVGELYGVGRYGEDAFRMFCLGDFSVEPKDRYLKIYKAWYEMNEKNERIKEMNS